MTINVAETIKKLMGWCPQKGVDFFQAQTKSSEKINSINVNPARSSGGSIEEMRVPLDMFDWRKLAFVLFLGFSAFILIFVSYFNRMAMSYLGIVMIYFIFIILFFLFDQSVVSINPERLQIKTPLLGYIKIPKQQINCIETIKNRVYELGWVKALLIIFTLLFALLRSLDLYRQIMRFAALDEIILGIANSLLLIFIFVSSIYRNGRRSHFPNAIRINAGNKSITLYPGNEFEFNLLKEELER